MIVKCPICKSEYDCTPGKYQCDCGVKFYVAADGSTSTEKPTMGTANDSQIILRKAPPTETERKFVSRCPYCGNAYQGTEAEIGQVTSCVNCGKQIIIQRDEENVAPPESEKKFVSRCPYCGEAYQGTETEIGQITSCVTCGKQIIIQRDDSNATLKNASAPDKKIASNCPYCGNPYFAKESEIGQVMRCTNCGKQLIIQHEDSTQPQQNTFSAVHSIAHDEKKAGNMIRSLARFIDLSLPWTIIAVAWTLISPRTFALITSNKIFIIINWGTLIIPIVLESILYKVFFWTPGKALFGIRVVNRNGNFLTAEEYRNRNWRFIRSILYGLPIIWLFGASKQQKLISKGLPTSYDEESGDRVIYHNPSAIKTFFGFIVVAVIILFYILSYSYLMEEIQLGSNTSYGEADDHYKMAIAYLNGSNGVEKNPEEAVKLLRQAAEQGHVGAQLDLGLCYCNGSGVEKNYDEAATWFRKSAEQGCPAAQSQLGLCYIKGEGVVKNYNTGFQWSLKAAEQGDAIGQNIVSYCYIHGYGVKRDLTEAVKWGRKAAEQNNVYAQCNLGDYYASGTGGEKNLDEAIKWYRKAAEQGFEPAKEALKRLER